MRLLLRAGLLLLLLAGSFAVTTGTASALSCVDPAAAAGSAQHVFTGSITDAHDGRIDVTVDEIWKGGPLAKHVTLGTELNGWWSGMKNGRIPDGYRSTSTWLFMSSVGKDGVQAVNPCTAWARTQPWGKDLRPTSVMAALGDDTDFVARSVATAAAVWAFGR